MPSGSVGGSGVWARVWLVVLAACAGPAPIDGGTDAGVDGGRIYVPAPFEPTGETRAYCPIDDDEVEVRITALLAQLSVVEKTQLMAGASGALVDGTWAVTGNERLGLPGLRMLDGPRGLSQLSRKRGTAFPVAMMRGASFDPALEERVGAAIARELRSAGADVLLAPTVNVLRHPRWGRAQETYGEDVHHLGAMGVAFVRGAQSEGMIASAKHFAANSIEDTRHTVDVSIDERTLREIYLPHFRRLVVEGQVGSVMSAYNQVNGAYCDLNRHLLREILKEEWGFAGFVVSDWILGTHGDAASVEAGLDVEMPTNAHFRSLAFLVDHGMLEEQRLDESVRRILRAQLCYGLDTRERVLDDPSARETGAHRALAREVAVRGMVLLENRGPEGARALPLDAGLSVVVLGRNADRANIGDEGSSAVSPSDVVTAWEGISSRAPGAVLLEGVSLDAAGQAAVASADAVVVVTGLTQDDEGENGISAGDRESLALPSEELALIADVAARNDRVIVVLEGGAALLVEPFVDDVEGVLHAFYPGSEGGHALAAVLFGQESPSGRLPFSVPRAESDLPAFDNVSETVTYGYYHGYRHLQREGTPARYPFGYGLSYTSFRYDAVRLAAAEVSADGQVELEVDVTNTGATAGRETVQVYVAAMGSRVDRAPRELRAFGQLELEPGASGTLALTVPARDLAFYDVETSAWIVESLTYRLEVGPNADTLPLSATFRVRE